MTIKESIKELIATHKTGYIEIADDVYLHFTKGRINCIQMSLPINIESTLVGEAGGNIYLKEKD